MSTPPDPAMQFLSAIADGVAYILTHGDGASMDAMPPTPVARALARTLTDATERLYYSTDDGIVEAVAFPEPVVVPQRMIAALLDSDKPRTMSFDVTVDGVPFHVAVSR